MTNCVIHTVDHETSTAVTFPLCCYWAGKTTERASLRAATEQRSELALSGVLEQPHFGFRAQNSLPSEHRGKAMAAGEMVVIQTAVFVLIAVCNST